MTTKNEITHVYKAIQAIQSQGLTVEKTGRNDFHKYNYVREEDVVEVLRKAFKENDLILLINTVSVEHTNNLTVGLFEFTLMSMQDGSTYVTKIPGEGADKGDKGSPKALTMATKYFLTKTALLSTGDDAEADEKTDERVTSKGIDLKSRLSRTTSREETTTKETTSTRGTGRNLLQELKDRRKNSTNQETEVENTIAGSDTTGNTFLQKFKKRSA